ncbi:MAG TPA: hypothetical protein VGF65_11180 [Mycobacterium sp.]|jgi:hypothetical protein
MSTNKMIRELSKDGWTGAVGPGGHVVFRHPDAAYPVYSGATPSDEHRVMKNVRATMRRSIKAGKGRKTS